MRSRILAMPTGGKDHARKILDLVDAEHRAVLVPFLGRWVMKNRIIKFMLIVLLIFSIIGCATVFYPSRLKEQPEDTIYQFDIGMCFVDVFFWGIFGIIYDSITGAIWIPYTPEEWGEEESQYIETEWKDVFPMGINP